MGNVEAFCWLALRLQEPVYIQERDRDNAFTNRSRLVTDRIGRAIAAGSAHYHVVVPS